MTYAKFINETTIEYAPSACEYGNVYQSPPPEWWMTENGYKPVEYASRPSEEGYDYVMNWRDEFDKIVQEWNAVPLSDIVTSDEIVSALEGIL